MSDCFHILLIEDSRADVKIIQRALSDGEVPHRLIVASNGPEALAYLDQAGAAAPSSTRFPDLILLDLNLPGMDGEQVLASLKSDPLLRAIPVIVLTTSRQEDDVLRTYLAGANTYIQKPAEYPSYQELVQTIRSYWRDTALRPTIRRAPP
ncbi:MAG: response regulator [Isosphaeraceae bacterium]